MLCVISAHAWTQLNVVPSFWGKLGQSLQQMLKLGCAKVQYAPQNFR